MTTMTIKPKLTKIDLKQSIRDIPDFPKPGIVFKDITPIFKDPQLCSDIVQAFIKELKDVEIDDNEGKGECCRQMKLCRMYVLQTGETAWVCEPCREGRQAGSRPEH